MRCNCPASRRVEECPCAEGIIRNPDAQARYEQDGKPPAQVIDPGPRVGPIQIFEPCVEMDTRVGIGITDDDDVAFGAACRFDPCLQVYPDDEVMDVDSDCVPFLRLFNNLLLVMAEKPLTVCKHERPPTRQRRRSTFRRCECPSQPAFSHVRPVVMKRASVQTARACSERSTRLPLNFVLEGAAMVNRRGFPVRGRR